MKRNLVLLFAVVCLLGVSALPTQAWGVCAQFHTVRRGETLASIARLYGTSFPYLASINGIVNPNRIFWGQVLCVVVSNPPPQQTIYVVQRGDWLARIAQRFGVSLFALIQANPLMNPNLIFPGQVLFIPTVGSYSTNSPQAYTIPPNSQPYAPPLNIQPYTAPANGGSTNPLPPNATPEPSY